MNNTVEHTAELSMIYAIPIVMGKLKPSRTRNLLERLQRQVTQQLQGLPKIGDHELQAILAKVYKWGENTGWLDSSKHIGTVTSFALELIEESKHTYNKEIITTLNAIIEHLENGKEFYQLSPAAARIALSKWKEEWS